MSDDRRTKRVSKSEWLEAALEVLEREGVDAVRVQRLARKLQISKSGFYWHFKDRNDLLQQLLDHWAHEYTEVVSENELLASLEPRERLYQITRMIDRHKLGKYDVVIHSWARADPLAKAATDKVTKIRLEFLRKIFRELGFDRDQVEMRAVLFIVYHSWERTTFEGMSDRKRESLRKLRLELLTS